MDGFETEIPLLAEEDAVNQTEPVEDTKGKGPIKPVAEMTLVERLIFSVLVAGTCSCFVGPLVYYQQTKLTDIKALRETQVALKGEVDRLASENKRLEEDVKELGKIVDELEDVEHTFEVMSQHEGQNVETFKKQVESNRRTLRQLDVNLRCGMAQNLIDIVCESDVDENNKIDDDEVDTVVSRVKDLTGVEIKREHLQELLKTRGNSIQSAIDIILDLLMDENGDYYLLKKKEK